MKEAFTALQILADEYNGLKPTVGGYSNATDNDETVTVSAETAFVLFNENCATEDMETGFLKITRHGKAVMSEFNSVESGVR